MKTFISIFLILLATSLCKAQTGNVLSTTDSKIKDKINELERNKIDSIICYYVDCIGYEHATPLDSCLAFDIKYLLWGKKGKHYIQRFDECKEHNVSEVNKDVFALLKKNYAEIKIAKIKYPGFTFKENGKFKTYYSYVDHSCHNIFEIHTKNKILKKDIDDYALETKYNDEKHLNMNFYLNQKSILNKLKIAVENEVNVYNKNN